MRDHEVREFWEDRARRARAGDLSANQATSLTSTPEEADQRTTRERGAVLDALRSVSGRLLELGCGTGRLTLEAARHFKHVDAVDYCEDFLELARAEAEAKRIHNITFLQHEVTTLELAPGIYDACLIAGLHLHLGLISMRCLRRIVRDARIPYLVVKESVGTFGRVELHHHWSETLRDYYSAIYRSIGEMIDLWTNADYLMESTSALEYHRPETHLRLFVFRLGDRV